MKQRELEQILNDLLGQVQKLTEEVNLLKRFIGAHQYKHE